LSKSVTNATKVKSASLSICSLGPDNIRKAFSSLLLLSLASLGSDIIKTFYFTSAQPCSSWKILRFFFYSLEKRQNVKLHIWALPFCACFFWVVIFFEQLHITVFQAEVLMPSISYRTLHRHWLVAISYSYFNQLSLRSLSLNRLFMTSFQPIVMRLFSTSLRFVSRAHILCDRLNIEMFREYL